MRGCCRRFGWNGLDAIQLAYAGIRIEVGRPFSLDGKQNHQPCQQQSDKQTNLFLPQNRGNHVFSIAQGSKAEQSPLTSRLTSRGSVLFGGRRPPAQRDTEVVHGHASKYQQKTGPGKLRLIKQ